jgi:hypothetical protein
MLSVSAHSLPCFKSIGILVVYLRPKSLMDNKERAGRAIAIYFGPGLLFAADWKKNQ